MKILQVMAGAKHGGAETAFVDMCVALHEAGEDIEVVTRANAVRVSRLKQAGIVVHTLPFAGKVDVYTRWAMRRIIKKFKPDIVQSWMARASSFVPAWEDSMGTPPYKTVARLGGYYKLKYFKTTDYFVTITPMIRDYLIKEGISADHIRQVNNFADVDKPKNPISRVDFETPEDATVVLGLGRLHEAKAFDVLIRSVKDLEDVYVWIAGEGPDRKPLEALIKELGLESRVKLLGWQTDRAALFEQSDICAFISRFEPFGTVFVQSWAQKVPVIVSDADGPKQFVKDGVDGLIVPKDDPDALSKAITTLNDDENVCETLIENGYQRYQNEFTKEKSVQNYLDWYHQIKSL